MKEHDIRPSDLFSKYLSLAAIDAETFFTEEELEEVNCPVCEKPGEKLFTKLSFCYNECPICFSIYASPRPIKQALDRFYESAESTKFWATDFYRVTADQRRERLWKPKARQIMETIYKYSPDAEWIVDIGGGYGIFVDEFSKISDLRAIVIEPSSSLAGVCRSRGIEVVECTIEDARPEYFPPGKGCFVSFELFEHLHSPAAFVRDVHKLLPSGGLFVFTTLSGMGVDIQVLREYSNSIFPPHHLNFLNPKAAGALLAKEGFEILSVSTPGKLDLDILANNLHHVRDPFWKTLFSYCDEIQIANLQEAFVRSNLSSHMMVVARKI